MDVDSMELAKDAASFAYKDERWSNVRMTMDWLDFRYACLANISKDRWKGR